MAADADMPELPHGRLHAGPGFGARLRRARAGAGLSQEALAGLAGIGVRTLRQLETGQRDGMDAATFHLLAGALELAGQERRRLLTGQAAPEPERFDRIAGEAPLIGRERELAGLEALLADPRVRIVSLVGPGGVGKTRLAGEAALRSAVPAQFVPLAGVGDPSDVLPAIAAAVVAGRGGDLRDALARGLRGQRMLLVLDNLEHLLGAGPDIAWLLRAAPGVTVLATSREALGVSGERVIAVAPLDASSVDGDAVRLFVRQAERVDGGFAPDGEGLEAVRDICRRVGGLPLAIELLAAAMHHLSPRHLLSLLDAAGIHAIAESRRDGEARHARLDAAIAWSWDLLDPAQQAALEAMAVFPGGFDLDALAAVVADAEALAPTEATPRAALAVRALAAKSLAGRQPALPADEEPRYALLEPIREFVLGQARASGRERALRHAHARAMLARFVALFIAANSAGTPSAHAAGVALDRMERDYANARAAVDWALANGERELASGLMNHMTVLWVYRDRLEEGQSRFDRLRAASDALTVDGEIALRYIGAELAFRRGDAARVRALAGGYRELAREAGLPAEEAGALLHLSAVEPDPAAALALVREAEAVLGPDADLAIRPFVQAWLAGRLGIELHRLGRLEEARAAFERGVRLKRAQANWLGLRNPLSHLALALEDLGQPRAAAEPLLEAVEVAADAGDAWAALQAGEWLADLADRHGGPDARAIAAVVRAALLAAADRDGPGLVGSEAVAAALERAAALPELLPASAPRRDGLRPDLPRLE